MAEINASLAAIQSQLDELNLKKSALEHDRLALIERIAADQQNLAVEGGVSIVVRVSGERSVVLLINGREQEVQLSGVMVKMGYGDDAKAFLNRELLLGIAYPRCVEPSCSEVELFTSKDKQSLNCQLVTSGLAMLLSGSNLQCTNSTAVKAKAVDDSKETSPPDVSVGSGSSGSSKQAPGTDVKVRGYYRKDGTYVRPHTRSAPRKGKN